MNNKDATFIFCFNEDDEQDIHQLFFSVDDRNKVRYQDITLNSNCNSTTIKLYDNVITPDKLRDLANQLEKWMIQRDLQKSQ